MTGGQVVRSDGTLTVGVLGPLTVSVAGRPIELTAGRLRTLLAAMAVSANRTVSVDRLIAALWDGDMPNNARRGVQLYLTRLRGVLSADVVVTEPDGYRLAIAPDRVDALRFAQLLDAAAQAPDPATEVAQLDEALALWRGTPFQGVRSEWLTRTEAPRLVERHLAAIERRVDLALAEGRPGELVAYLRELTALHPLRESLWARLLVVLDRSGRQAEALQWYETIRVRLRDELGTDPGPELRQIHTDLLTGRSSGNAPEMRSVRAGSPPRQLPADIDGFTGRAAALAALNDALDGRRDRAPTAMVICAIAGTAGVGKTALAVHWAHQIADRFPDGQLFVDLRGFHPSGQAMSPSEALRVLLAALDVPAQQVPSDLDAQVGLYRSRLAGRRMLIVLDNARRPDQIRPLLPGAPGCLAIVTSRDQLTGIIAAEDAKPLAIDLLTPDEARRLLARRLGADRVAAEPAATEEIITRCARLPLALAIAAAFAVTRPGLPLATVAAQLRDQGTGLDAFTSGDPETDARAVFSWSYEALSPGAARLFRLLGLAFGPDISQPAAASLAALPMRQALPLLAELCRAHLLTEHTTGRYVLHDLLHDYAAELARDRDGDAERHLALHRLLDHYLHTGQTAARLANTTSREPIAVPPSLPGVSPEELANYEQAVAWYDAEHSVLVAGVRHAATTGFDTHTWQLAWVVDDFLYLRSRWHDQAASQRAAVAALSRLGDRVEQANARRHLARAYIQLGRYDDAEQQLAHALVLHRDTGVAGGEARTLRQFSWLLQVQGRHAEALEPSRRALDLFRALGHRVGEADALNSLAWTLSALGDYDGALDHCRRSLRLHRELGHKRGEAGALDSLGTIHHQLGQYRRALACYQEALEIAEDLGDRYDATRAMTHIGETQLADGDPGAARASWLKALSILDELDHPDAVRVRARLDALPSAGY